MSFRGLLELCQGPWLKSMVSQPLLFFVSLLRGKGTVECNTHIVNTVWPLFKGQGVIVQIGPAQVNPGVCPVVTNSTLNLLLHFLHRKYPDSRFHHDVTNAKQPKPMEPKQSLQEGCKV